MTTHTVRMSLANGRVTVENPQAKGRELASKRAEVRDLVARFEHMKLARTQVRRSLRTDADAHHALAQLEVDVRTLSRDQTFLSTGDMERFHEEIGDAVTAIGNECSTFLNRREAIRQRVRSLSVDAIRYRAQTLGASITDFLNSERYTPQVGEERVYELQLMTDVLLGVAVPEEPERKVRTAGVLQPGSPMKIGRR
jgi:hypothetical protein